MDLHQKIRTLPASPGVYLYKDAEGRWKSTDSLGREDLLLAAKVLDLAHSWIYLEAKGPDSPIDPISAT